MGSFLPNTALTSVSVNKDVFVECQGHRRTSSAAADVYSYQWRNHVIARDEDGVVAADAPKLFTLMAATEMDGIKVRTRDHLSYSNTEMHFWKASETEDHVGPSSRRHGNEN
jgi:hypothetical protein